MNHLSEEQLVFYYYGEAAEAGSEQQVAEHMGACETCRASYHALQRVLNSVDSFPVPERPADYEARVWQAIEAKLPRRSWLQQVLTGGFAWKPLAVAASMAVLLVGAFLAGRTWQKPGLNINQGKPAAVTAGNQADAGQVRERVLLVAVGDHLERSQMILVELANAGAPAAGRLDISYQQLAAEDLLESNRLYRQTAASTGDVATATLLEDLERVLLEIAHSPSAVSAKQLEDLRRQIEDRGILFKVKVFGSQMDQREAAPQAASKSTSL
jgi:hypothetical protein